MKIAKSSVLVLRYNRRIVLAVLVANSLDVGKRKVLPGSALGLLSLSNGNSGCAPLDEVVRPRAKALTIPLSIEIVGRGLLRAHNGGYISFKSYTVNEMTSLLAINVVSETSAVSGLVRGKDLKVNTKTKELRDICTGSSGLECSILNFQDPTVVAQHEWPRRYLGVTIVGLLLLTSPPLASSSSYSTVAITVLNSWCLCCDMTYVHVLCIRQ